MSFLISATDICGRVTLRRETADAAIKKAAELAADGYRDVAITGPDGRPYSPQAFDELQGNGWAACFNWTNCSEPRHTVIEFLPIDGDVTLSDQQTMLRAVSNAQRILEEYLEPRPHDNERLLNRLVEALDRNEVVTALRRLQHGYTL
jgi:hypothetical protein